MHWIASFFARSRKPSRPLLRGRRLSFERLEERVVLSGDVYLPTFSLLHPTGNASPHSSQAPSGLTPTQVRTAYGANLTTFGSILGDGTGQTIAIIDAYDDPNIASDLKSFDSAYGIADLPSFSFTKLNQSGGTSLPGAAGTSGWDVEESLDVEWAHVMAPGAKIILFEANSASFSNLNAAVNTAKNYAGVSVVSMSYGSDETSSSYSSDSVYTTPSGHNGVTFVASSGDAGSYSSNGAAGQVVSYPASSPNVVGVGGTYLSVNSNGAYVSESGWGSGTSSRTAGGSGGGISRYAAQPSYQSGVVTQSTTLRTVPDVSLDASPSSGVPVYDSYSNSASAPWEQVGGTSLAAPLFAGVIAVADQGRAANGLGTLDGRNDTLPKIYSVASTDFHDVTNGNNGYAAAPGYDLVTGRGTPIVNLFVGDLVGTSSAPRGTPSIGTFSASPASVTAGTAVTLTAGGVAEVGGTGSIAGVKFYLGSLSSTPLAGTYNQSTGTWTASLATGSLSGAYTLYAVATDSNGNTSTAASATLTVTAAPAGTPTISTFSVGPASVTAGAAVTLTATAAEVGGTGTIAGVSFYLGSLSSTPLAGTYNSATGTWTFSLSTAGLSGAYTLYAVATDGNGVTSAAATATLTVTAPPTGTPSIGTFSASPGSVTAGTAVTLTATAAETGGSGTITGVKFYLGSLSSTPLTGTLNPSTGAWTYSLATGSLTGTYTLYAVATDSNGVTSAAASTTLTVTSIVGPVATTTSLSAGTVHYHRNGTASVVLTATVKPPTGSVPAGGTVDLMYQGAILGKGTLQIVNGVARVTFTVTFSSYSLYTWDYYTFSAVYEGASGYNSSLSNSVTVAV